MKSINERMNEKIIVRNVGGFNVSLPNTSLNKKGYLLKPNGVARISIGELFEMQNSLLGGFDGEGYLSPLKIEDKEVRLALGYSKEVPDRKDSNKTFIVEQKFFEEKEIIKTIKNKNKFPKLLEKIRKNGLLGHRNSMIDIASKKSSDINYADALEIQEAFGVR